MSQRLVTPLKETFADLLEESLGAKSSFEGQVVSGTVVGISDDFITIDVGLKSEGRVPKREFGGKASKLTVGDVIQIFVDRMEDRHGEIVLSYEKARRESAWQELEDAYKKEEKVLGTITGRIKGGFSVDVSGAIAFLPGSQVDVRAIKDVSSLMNIEQPFVILKMDRLRGNIVVSRRAVLEESRAEARSEVISQLKEGQVVQGVIKNLTEYGAFVDLGGVDGLLHVTDICWARINNPSDKLHVGQNVTVQVIRFNQQTQRISLGMKQLEKDPWADIADRYVTGQLLKGVVTNVAEYGVFVELEEGVEGLIHVSELSWTKKNVHPNKIVSSSETVEVKVLDVDPVKRRISLSLRQCYENPWEVFAAQHKVGDIVHGEIKNITDFGFFLNVAPELDGMVHCSDLSWNSSGEESLKEYAKGQKVQAKILEIDAEKERISLGVKQLTQDPFSKQVGSLKVGDLVTCTVKAITAGGIEVYVGSTEDVLGFIKKSDLSRDRSEQRTDRFAAGERLDAMVTSVDSKTRQFNLSIKAQELKEEKEAMAEYGSSDSGASLGDILGASIDLEKLKEGKKVSVKKKQEQESGDQEVSKKIKKEPKTKKLSENSTHTEADETKTDV